MLGRRVVAACALSCALALAAPVSAHEERSLHALTVLDKVEPAIPGIEVRVVHLGAPALAIDNRSREILTVFDGNGEPFLRIGPRGVQGNVSSPMTYRSLEPGAHAPARTRSDAPPRWVWFSDRSRWSWFDPRLTFPGTEWTVPMAVGGRSMIASGGFEPLDAHGHFESEFVTPDVEGLKIKLVQGPIPALFVRNDTDETLHVPGLAGEPFLRIGPRGVMANLNSPSYYNAAAGGAIQDVPRRADARAAPSWKKVSTQPTWAWLERRAAVAPEMEQRAGLGPVRRTVLTWTTDLRLADRPIPARGEVVWVPPESAGGHHEGISWTMSAAVMFSVAILIAGFLYVRRHRMAPA